MKRKPQCFCTNLRSIFPHRWFTNFTDGVKTFSVLFSSTLKSRWTQSARVVMAATWWQNGCIAHLSEMRLHHLVVSRGRWKPEWIPVWISAGQMRKRTNLFVCKSTEETEAGGHHQPHAAMRKKLLFIVIFRGPKTPLGTTWWTESETHFTPDKYMWRLT